MSASTAVGRTGFASAAGARVVKRALRTTVRERFGSWVPRLFGAQAITLLPLGIFYATSAEGVPGSLRRHEAEHVRQVFDHGLVGFYAAYLWQWARVGFRYRAIPFEVEAFARQDDPSWPVPDDVLPRRRPV